MVTVKLHSGKEGEQLNFVGVANTRGDEWSLVKGEYDGNSEMVFDVQGSNPK